MQCCVQSQITILNVNSTAEGQYSCMAVGVTAEETLPAMYAFCSKSQIYFFSTVLAIVSLYCSYTHDYSQYDQ